MQAYSPVRASTPDAQAPTPENPLEISVLFTERPLALAALDRAGAFAQRLTPAIRLIAVHAVPYPLEFGCPASAHAHLVEQLVEIASHSRFPVHAEVVLARSREEGFRAGLPRDSTVLLASRRRPWRTPEEKLGAMLSAQGHQVALFYME